jgi:hypothetical protein
MLPTRPVWAERAPEPSVSPNQASDNGAGPSGVRIGAAACRPTLHEKAAALLHSVAAITR